MTTALSDQSLKTLAAKANAEHRSAISYAQQAVEHAWRAGDFLLQAKQNCQHGEWLPWLEDNFDGSQQTASDYMRLRRKYQHAGNLPDSIRQALAAPKKPKASKFTPAVEAYLRAGLIHEGHAYQFERLQFLNIEEKYRSGSCMDIKDGGRAGALLYIFRPGEHAPLARIEHLDLFREAFGAFWDGVQANGNTVPLWQRHAMWWATVAAESQMTVTQLTDAISAWKDRFVAAMLYMQIWDKPPKPSDGSILHDEWWGHYADLKHAGALEWMGHFGTPVQDDVMNMIATSSITLPSSFMPFVPGGQERLEAFRKYQDRH